MGMDDDFNLYKLIIKSVETQIKENDPPAKATSIASSPRKRRSRRQGEDRLHHRRGNLSHHEGQPQKSAGMSSPENSQSWNRPRPFHTPYRMHRTALPPGTTAGPRPQVHTDPHVAAGMEYALWYSPLHSGTMPGISGSSLTFSPIRELRS